MIVQTHDEFLAEHTTGWVAVYVGKDRAPAETLFVNVTGPFETKKDALREVSRLRAGYKREVAKGTNASTLVKVSARPLWKPEAKA